MVYLYCMKKILILLFVAFYSLQINAQEADENKHELAFNASQFLSNYLNFNGFAQTNNNYILTYKYDLGPLRLRSGINAYVSNVNRTDNWGNDFRSSNLNFRIGVEKQKELNQHFDAFIGVDLVTDQASGTNTQKFELWDGNESKMVDRNIVNKNELYGVAPVAGIQWNFSKRLSIYTEARAVIAYGETENFTEWDGVNQGMRDVYGEAFFDRNFRGSYNRSLQFFVPLDIFLALNF